MSASPTRASCSSSPSGGRAPMRSASGSTARGAWPASCFGATPTACSRKPGPTGGRPSTSISITDRSSRPMTETAAGPRILVVDDNDDNRYTLTLYLELEGYADLDVAHDGEQAIARLAADAYDLVLLDV